MGREEAISEIEEVIRQFSFDGVIVKWEPYGSGHINDTFRLICRLPGGGEKFYILQRMNRAIFKKPEELMANAVVVTRFLRKKIEEQGGRP